jgi:hypothetical protein
MVMIATFGVSAGVPTVQELYLMPVTRHWLPVDDGFGKQLVDKLVAEGRAFTRNLPYELPAKVPLTFAVLSDCGELPTSLGIRREDHAVVDEGAPEGDTVAAAWLWHAHLEPLPALPARSPRGGERAGQGRVVARGMLQAKDPSDFATDRERSALSLPGLSDEGTVP